MPVTAPVRRWGIIPVTKRSPVKNQAVSLDNDRETLNYRKSQGQKARNPSPIMHPRPPGPIQDDGRMTGR
jgi:hypothetical protein